MAAIEAIKTTRLESWVSSITLSSIPSSYEHLELRVSAAGNRASYASDIAYLRFNSSTTSYTDQAMLGSAPNSEICFAQGSRSRMDLYRLGSIGVGKRIPYGALIIQIRDYANTSKNTTVVAFGGTSAVDNTSNDRQVSVCGGAWHQTTAISSIEFGDVNGTYLMTGSVVSLYGIRSS